MKKIISIITILIVFVMMFTCLFQNNKEDCIELNKAIKYEIKDNVDQKVIENWPDPFSYIIIYEDDTFKIHYNMCEGFYTLYGEINNLNGKKVLNVLYNTLGPIESYNYEIDNISEYEIKINDFYDCGLNSNKIFSRVKCERYIVKNKLVLVFKEPNYNSESLFSISRNTIVNLFALGKDEKTSDKIITWVKVKDQNDKIGWCDLNELKRDKVAYFR